VCVFERVCVCVYADDVRKDRWIDSDTHAHMHTDTQACVEAFYSMHVTYATQGLLGRHIYNIHKRIHKTDPHTSYTPAPHAVGFRFCRFRFRV
jgi:hypothetical protein